MVNILNMEIKEAECLKFPLDDDVDFNKRSLKIDILYVTVESLLSWNCTEQQI